MHIIVTGGTIDKRYNPLSGQVDFASFTHIEAMLLQARLDTQTYSITTLMLKDSLELDNSDREAILSTIQTSPHNKILITHGTDTMVESASFIAQGIQDKTVVLVGAMVPYRFKDSDALFNLGFAMGALKHLDSGVYIAMNGKAFTYDSVTKNKTLGIFEAK